MVRLPSVFGTAGRVEAAVVAGGAGEAGAHGDQALLAALAAADVDAPVRLVEILPRECERFADAQAGVCGEEQQEFHVHVRVIENVRELVFLVRRAFDDAQRAILGNLHVLEGSASVAPAQRSARYRQFAAATLSCTPAGLRPALSIAAT